MKGTYRVSISVQEGNRGRIWYLGEVWSARDTVDGRVQGVVLSRESGSGVTRNVWGVSQDGGVKKNRRGEFSLRKRERSSYRQDLRGSSLPVRLRQSLFTRGCRLWLHSPTFDVVVDVHPFVQTWTPFLSVVECPVSTSFEKYLSSRTRWVLKILSDFYRSSKSRSSRIRTLLYKMGLWVLFHPLSPLKTPTTRPCPETPHLTHLYSDLHHWFSISHPD